MTQDLLSATDIYKFFQCPHWPFFDRHATSEERALRREQTAAEVARMEHTVANEREIVCGLYASDGLSEIGFSGDCEGDAERTLAAMQAGAKIIYRGTLRSGDWVACPDLLMRSDVPRGDGDWTYWPADVKTTHRVEKYQKIQLVFYGLLLERVQGVFPARGRILTVDGEGTDILLSDHLAEARDILDELERIRAGERPEPVLRKSCYDGGPWGLACERLAVMNHDIALLFNVDRRRSHALRQIGIRTIQDAEAMDPAQIESAAPGLRLHGLEVMKNQARSLSQQSVIIREPIVLPSVSCEIFFDIESDQPYDRDYLYGVMRVENGASDYVPLLARRREDEEQMWREFLAWVDALPPDYAVYHFGQYECSRLDVLVHRYGGSTRLEEFRERMIDIQDALASSVIFPLYFYSLKHIAAFLGFAWRGSVKSGGQSVDVFESYVETGDETLLRELVTYNEDDVRATSFLVDWINAYAGSVNEYVPSYPWIRGGPFVRDER